MKAIGLSDHLTESELTEKIRHEKDASVRDRYRAILWIHQGESRSEIAKRLGIGCNTLYRWVKRYNSDGESGLHRRPGQGRKRTLTPERVEQIKSWVKAEEGVWTLKRMRLKLYSGLFILLKRKIRLTKVALLQALKSAFMIFSGIVMGHVRTHV